jgi:hypothetical protein
VDSPGLLGQLILATVATQAALNSDSVFGMVPAVAAFVVFLGAAQANNKMDMPQHKKGIAFLHMKSVLKRVMLKVRIKLFAFCILGIKTANEKNTLFPWLPARPFPYSSLSKVFNWHIIFICMKKADE